MQAEVITPPIKYGNISLDVDTHEVRGPRGAIRLREKCFNVLHSLIVKPGAIRSNDYLISRVWPVPSDEPENPDAALKVIITEVRGALKAVGYGGDGNRTIQREISYGYFLCPMGKKSRKSQCPK